VNWMLSFRVDKNVSLSGSLSVLAFADESECNQEMRM